MLVDAFRLSANTLEETVANIIGHYSTQGGGWNHQRCLRSIMHGYNGATDTAALVAGCRGEGKKSQVDNAKIVEAVLPKVMGRNTQCFPYKRSPYALTPRILCPMGPSFFIVENGVIKLVYVHARNENRASLSDLAGLASVLKTDVLEQEFYGQVTDIELHYVDKKGSARSDSVYNLRRLQTHLREEPSVTLARFASALVDVMENDRVTPPARPRKERRADEETEPRFDF